MRDNALGKVYADGEVILRQGEASERMYVIQEGKVEIVIEKDGKETILAVSKPGDFFGEMSIFERDVQMATVRALGAVRVLSVDRKNLMRRIHEDPSLGYQIIQKLSARNHALAAEVAHLQAWILEIGIPLAVETSGGENQ